MLRLSVGDECFKKIRRYGDTIFKQGWSERVFVRSGHPCKRSSDLWSESFTVLVVEASGLNEQVITSHLQEKLNAFNMRANRPYRLTVRFGIVHFDSEHPCTLEQLLKQADELVYGNKRNKQLKED